MSTNLIDDDDNEDKMLILPSEEYVIEPIEANDSDQEEYVEFELDNRHDDRSIQSMDENTAMEVNEYELIRKQPCAKRLRQQSILDSSPTFKRTTNDNSLIEFQKKLMQLEYEEMRKLRAEKHSLEIAILKAELAHKTMEHQKQMELLNKKLNNS